MKKMLIMLLCMVMVLGTGNVFASAASQGTASTIRLEKTSGSVEVTNSSGKIITAVKGARLQSGYKLKTQKASYAYMSLDSSKAVKLDASSSARVRKAGNALEVYCEKGKLMFNVSEPLGSNEALRITTSTMSTGIRGTAGWVEEYGGISTFYLLEGSTETRIYDSVNGQNKKVNLSAGQAISVIINDIDIGAEINSGIEESEDTVDIPGLEGSRELLASAETGDYTIVAFSYTEDDIPGFVAKAIAEDKALQEKIADESDLSVKDIVSGAAQKLAEEEAEADAAYAEIKKNFDETKATSAGNSQVYNRTSGGSGGGGGGVAPDPTPTSGGQGDGR